MARYRFAQGGDDGFAVALADKGEREEGFVEVVGHRDLPLLFVDCLQARGIGVTCDPELGILDRRAKDEEEVEALRVAQVACGYAHTVLLADGDSDVVKRLPAWTPAPAKEAEAGPSGEKGGPPMKAKK